MKNKLMQADYADDAENYSRDSYSGLMKGHYSHGAVRVEYYRVRELLKVESFKEPNTLGKKLDHA